MMCALFLRSLRGGSKILSSTSTSMLMAMLAMPMASAMREPIRNVREQIRDVGHTIKSRPASRSFGLARPLEDAWCHERETFDHNEKYLRCLEHWRTHGKRRESNNSRIHEDAINFFKKKLQTYTRLKWSVARLSTQIKTLPGLRIATVETPFLQCLLKNSSNDQEQERIRSIIELHQHVHHGHKELLCRNIVSMSTEVGRALAKCHRYDSAEDSASASSDHHTEQNNKILQIVFEGWFRHEANNGASETRDNMLDEALEVLRRRDVCYEKLIRSLEEQCRNIIAEVPDKNHRSAVREAESQPRYLKCQDDVKFLEICELQRQCERFATVLRERLADLSDKLEVALTLLRTVDNSRPRSSSSCELN